MSRRDGESPDPKSSEVEIERDVEEQRATTTGETSANRGSNANPQEEARQGWVDLDSEERRKREH